LAKEVRALIVELARNDSNWGDSSIRDRLAYLGQQVSRSTIASVLKEHGIEPAPKRRRQTSWTTFIKAHWPSLAAIDFTTVEVWTKGGLVTCYVLFVMDLTNRQREIASLPAEVRWKQGRSLFPSISIDGNKLPTCFHA